MKNNSFINILLLSCLVTTLVVGDHCLHTLLESASYECDTIERTYNTSSLQLDSSSKAITVKFDLKLTDLCGKPPSEKLSYFSITIKPPGEDETKIGEFTWTESSKTLGISSEISMGHTPTFFPPWTTSLLNISTTHYLTISFGRLMIAAARNNKASMRDHLSLEFKDWTIDSTLKFYLCTDTAGNHLGCEISNFQANLDQNAESHLEVRALLHGEKSELIGDYRFDDSTDQSSVKDYSNNLGSAYLGTSSANTENAPTWLPSLNGVQMSKTTYVTLPTFQIAPVNSILPDSFSFAVNVWIKLDSLPTSGSEDYIFRYSSSDLATDRFALLITSEGFIKIRLVTAEYAMYVPQTFDTFPTGQWTSLSVTFFYDQFGRRQYFRVVKDNKRLDLGYMFDYDGTVILDPSDIVRVGGFEGALTKLQIFSPGPMSYNSPSCSSSCFVEIGLNNPPQCIIPSTCSAGEVCLGSLQTCSDGTYSSGETCLECAIGCELCTGPGDACQSCSDGFYLENSQCLPIGIPGCDVYTQTGECQKCFDEFYLDNNQCLSCSSLEACNVCGETGCEVCLDGFYKENSKCFPCATGCNTCTGSGASCYSCLNEYYLENSQCFLCNSLEGCAVCGVTGCEVCLDGFYKENSKCFPCATGCNTCTGPGASCQSCLDGFELENSACLPNSNIPGCNVYTQTGECQKCFDEFYLNNNQCLSCSSLEGCDVCGETGCDVCCEGYYKDNNNKCLACTSIMGCDVCGETGCEVCYDGFYLDNEECSLCDMGCHTCTGSGANCDSCYDGFYLKNGKCLNCNSMVGCDVCGETGCEDCFDRFYLDNETCSSCAPGCHTCTGPAANCQSCLDGFYLENSACLPCAPGCLTCTGPGPTCQSCLGGYALKVETSCQVIL